MTRHTAGVHRSVANTVTERHIRLRDAPDLGTLVGRWPEDRDPPGFYRREAANVADGLRESPDALETGVFVTIDPPRVFWARRQAREATGHRLDVRIALGESSDVAVEVAVDGIDEMLRDFIPRKRTRLHTPDERRIGFPVDETGDAWTVVLSETTPAAVRGIEGDISCSVTGPATDLYRIVWNRSRREHVTIDGNASLLDLFAESVRITW